MLTQSLVQLSQIGAENPITALIALSAALDPTSIQTVIEKMEVIRDSLLVSVEQEEELERVSKRDFDITMNNIFNALETLTREKSIDEGYLEECIRGRDVQSNNLPPLKIKVKDQRMHRLNFQQQRTVSNRGEHSARKLWSCTKQTPLRERKR